MMNRKPRVFVSFDFNNDKVLKDFIVGQSKLIDSPFEISDWSMKESVPQKNWAAEAMARIKRSDIVVVMIGPKTYRAPGVLKEVRIARSLKIPIFQIIGYRNRIYKPVLGAGRLYSWNWDNLKKLFQGIKR